MLELNKLSAANSHTVFINTGAGIVIELHVYFMYLDLKTIVQVFKMEMGSDARLRCHAARDTAQLATVLLLMSV